MPDHLSATFSALADPTRRAILARLAAGEASVNELAEPFDMTLPAVSKHLKVLERAGLIARSRAAQSRPCRLEAAPLKDAAAWIERYRRFWEESFDRLDAYLNELKERETMTASDGAAAELRRRELTVTRVLDAPRELVFRLWTDPEHAAQWWGPQGFTTISCDMDVRPGGAYRACMRSPTGTRHCRRGVYREVSAPERLVFTFAWEDGDGNPGHETLVTVTFADIGGKTELILHQAVFETASARDAHQIGWSSCLERFAEYLAALPANR